MFKWTVGRTKKVKEIRNVSNSVKCEICGEFHKTLNLHLKYKHHITPAKYLELYPNATLYAQGIKQKMRDNSYMAKHGGTDVLKFENRFTVETSAMLKKALANLRKSETGMVKKSEECKQKMRETWDKNREAWSLAIKTQANSPERKQMQSDIMKKRIAENGYHLARGKETKLEAFIRQCVEDLGYTVIKQKGTQKRTLGTVRFFDMYIEELNLLIEADGEYWHNRVDRIAIDRAKTEAAICEGYNFLRISDKELSSSLSESDAILVKAQLGWSAERQLHKSNQLIADREKFFGL